MIKTSIRRFTLPAAFRETREISGTENCSRFVFMVSHWFICTGKSSWHIQINTAVKRTAHECKKIFSVWRVNQSCWTQVGSTVCDLHWDEIRTSNNRCSVPRENHLRGIRKQRIPARLFAVLDAIGATCHGYKPGARWCYKCCTRMETRFTSHPD